MICKKLKIEFLKYKTSGIARIRENQGRTVLLLTEALKTEQFTDEETCWAYWNISDELALMKKQEEQYANHKLFNEHLLKMHEKYLHWLISDGTQKLNLFESGHEQFWNECYLYACEKSPKSIENQAIRYESHRATVAFPSLSEYKIDKNITYFALDNMKKMLDDELISSYNYNYYKITYYTQYINCTLKICKEIDQKIIDNSYLAYLEILDLLKCDRNEPDEGKGNEIYLIGSWQQLNYSKRSKFNQASIGIKNYIIALINAEKYDIALDCYEKLKPYNLVHNNYFKNQIEFAQKNLKLL